MKLLAESLERLSGGFDTPTTQAYGARRSILLREVPAMSDLVRLSLSLEKPLFDRLEKLVAKSGYTNRSEFVRDMIRERLVEGQWDKDREVLGTVTLVYDHHRRQLSERLTHLQHRHHRAILVTTHVHLTKELCVEVILVRAKASQVKQFADLLRKQKGVFHAELSMSSTGKGLQ